MSTDLKARIAELEDKLERAYAEINSLSRELSDSEDEVKDLQLNLGGLDDQIADLEDEILELNTELDDRSESTIAKSVADAIYRRDVLGLDDGDVLSIIHEKLEKSY